MRSIAFGCSMLALYLVVCGSANAQATNARAIYRCESDGALTFSDRPCAGGAEVYELDAKALNTFEPPPGPPASRRAAAKPKQTKKSPARAVKPDKQKQRCERLAQGLKDVRDKQRSGYSAKQGERLRYREKKLKSQLREARCR